MKQRATLLTRRRALIAGGTSLLLPKDLFAAGFPPKGAGSIVSNPLATLLAGMRSGQWIQLNNVGDNTVIAPVLPRTRANFDNGSLWPNDTPVPTAIGGGTPYSSAAIRTDGKIVFFGGGHSASEDSSVYTFDIQAAADSINHGGTGAGWGLATPSAGYLPGNSVPSGSNPNVMIGNPKYTGMTATFNSGSPNVQTSIAYAGAGVGFWPKADGFIPVGAKVLSWTGTAMVLDQNASASGAGVATLLIDDFLPAQNHLGNMMPSSPHSEMLCCPIPGTTKWFLGGYAPGFGALYQQTHAVCIFDDSTDRVTMYPCTPARATAGFGVLVSDGSNSRPGTMTIDVDGNVYTWANFQLLRWTNLQSTTPVNSVVVGSGRTTGPPTNSPLAFLRNGKRSLFFTTGNGGAGNGVPCIFDDIAIGGSPSFGVPTFTGSLPSPWGQSPCWDSKRGAIAVDGFGGPHIYGIMPTSGLTGWSVAEIGSPSGVTPAASSTSGEARLQYLPTWDCYVMAVGGAVYLRKP
jgi:hypothetical protein